ncbi:hypothetical protein [Pseudobacteriovorax antillogorgiicola]|uniref:Uncharacterized protein n=1 Tax=Pseudobacteriovorax antillogorgiicola TaxID=1513793 RepID=A0A1Y6CC05_9BACT|nr:hypothetical protein [Pseudobacteriovorax antillogorgiicola]TCS48355.1 hypothetical protein EDD56_118135 [Pseudobacteriovorax antillogorgiicola]SMF56242.1 hypothetical protein SAMN06296036_1186 [Pseudobacteriovorax antillogorgiicola]
MRRCKAAALVSVLTLGQACDREEKVVEVPVEVEPQPWYLAGDLQRNFYGEADELPIVGSNCFYSDRFHGISAVGSGQEEHYVEEVSYDLQLQTRTLSSIETFSSEMISLSESLTLCDEVYPERSREYVGLKVAKEVSQARLWYESNSNEEIKNVILEVLPLVKVDRYERHSDEAKDFVLEDDPDAQVGAQYRKSDMVYNAFYRSNYEGDPTIAFLPHHTAKSINDNVPTPMWEMPFVARHEYGHHVFSAHMFEKLQDKNLGYFEYLERNPFLHTTHAIRRANPQALRDTRLESSLIIGALNEGFSDLFSYYSSNQTLPGIENAPCMTMTRDPASPSMPGAIKSKKWTKEFLDYLFNVESDVEYDFTHDCGEFYLGSPHSLGAVIAHTVDQLLSTSNRVKNSANPSAEKTKLSLAWLDQLNQSLDFSVQGPKLVLSEILSGAALLATESAEPSVATCQVIRESFSGWKDVWNKQESSLKACFLEN